MRSAPIWTADPKNTPYRDPVKNLRPAGYAGKLGYASAGAAADFIIVNMVAEAISGSKTPKEAMERAQKRAETLLPRLRRASADSPRSRDHAVGLSLNSAGLASASRFFFDAR